MPSPATPNRRADAEVRRLSFDLASADSPAVSRKLFIQEPPADLVAATVLIAELHRAWQRECSRAAKLERELAATREKQLESERVAEHALKLANGVISAVRSVQKEHRKPASREGSRAGSRRSSGIGLRDASAAAAAAAAFKPSSSSAQTEYTRRVVDGVSVIQCALCCKYTCGTLSALERHRASVHSIRHKAESSLSAAVPVFRPPPPFNPRSPPLDPSERFGLHGPERDPKHRAARSDGVTYSPPKLTRPASSENAAACSASYAAPSVSWLRACAVANKSRARAANADGFACIGEADADTDAYVEFRR